MDAALTSPDAHSVSGLFLLGMLIVAAVLIYGVVVDPSWWEGKIGFSLLVGLIVVGGLWWFGIWP